jgi:hypothetical protein
VDGGVVSVVGHGGGPHPLAALSQLAESLTVHRPQQLLLGGRVSGGRRRDLAQLGSRQPPVARRGLRGRQVGQPFGGREVGRGLPDGHARGASHPPSGGLVAVHHMSVAGRGPPGGEQLRRGEPLLEAAELGHQLLGLDAGDDRRVEVA